MRSTLFVVQFICKIFNSEFLHALVFILIDKINSMSIIMKLVVMESNYSWIRDFFFMYISIISNIFYLSW